MYLRQSITRQKLYQLAMRLSNLLNAEKLFTFEKINLWRNRATQNPVEAIGLIADDLKSLRIETLHDYELISKNDNTNQENERS